MAESRAQELEREGVGVRSSADIVPVEHVLAQVSLPACRGGGERAVAETLWRRVRVGGEGGARVTGVAGPPADCDLLRVHRVAHDEVCRWRLGGGSREEADREVEGTPPGVNRSRAATIGSA